MKIFVYLFAEVAINTKLSVVGSFIDGFERFPALGRYLSRKKRSVSFMILNWVWYIAEIVLMGRLGAGKITDCVPDYNPADYKRRELIGIVVGAALIILGFCTIVLAAVVAAAAEMP